MIQTADQPDTLLSWMGALADPTRLRLLRLLEVQELGVSDLCDVLQMPQSTISRHLKLLTQQEWTRSRRQGTGNLYRMVLDELAPAARKLWLLAREQTEQWAVVHQDQERLIDRQRQREQAQRFFAGAAGEWDRMRRELYGGSFSRAAMLSLLPPHWVVADLGCGTGLVSAELGRYVRKVIGVDNSAGMLAAARTRVQDLVVERPRAEVELRRGDLEALPIEDGTCDAALLTLVLSYVAEPGAVIREMARVIRPGGRAVLVDLLPHEDDDFRRDMGQQSMGFSGDQVRRLLGSAGFAQARFEALTVEPKARGPALFLATATRPVEGGTASDGGG